MRNTLLAMLCCCVLISGVVIDKAIIRAACIRVCVPAHQTPEYVPDRPDCVDRCVEAVGEPQSK